MQYSYFQLCLDPSLLNRLGTWWRELLNFVDWHCTNRTSSSSTLRKGVSATRLFASVAGRSLKTPCEKVASSSPFSSLVIPAWTLVNTVLRIGKRRWLWSCRIEICRFFLWQSWWTALVLSATAHVGSLFTSPAFPPLFITVELPTYTISFGKLVLHRFHQIVADLQYYWTVTSQSCPDSRVRYLKGTVGYRFVHEWGCMKYHLPNSSLILSHRVVFHRFSSFLCETCLSHDTPLTLPLTIFFLEHVTAQVRWDIVVIFHL
jgi:hypothetical protein